MIDSIYNTLNELTQSSTMPVLTAILLGLLVILNPCQLAINISALTYLGKDLISKHELRKKSFVYIIGRTVTYTAMGWILMYAINLGLETKGIQQLLSKAETIIPFVMCAIGAFFIARAIFHHHSHGEHCHNSGTTIKRTGPFGALALGMTLALAFCPESAVFYFGILIPLSVNTSLGYLLPIVFALSAGFPIFILSYLINSAIFKARRIERKIEKMQLWFNLITGILFIALAMSMLF